MFFFSLTAGVVTGALGRRIAGGLGSQWAGVDLGTQPQRLAWGGMLAVLAWCLGLSWLGALGLILATFAGACVGMWGAWSIGTQPGRSTWRDAALMTVHGLAGVGLAAIGAWYLGYSPVPLVVAGLLCAPAYALGWARPCEAPFLGCYAADPVRGTDPPPTAELIWGGAVGLAVVVTLVG